VRSSSTGHFFGSEPSRHDDLEHLDVVAVCDLAVPDRRRLIDTGTRVEADRALALVFEFDPALQNMNELKSGLVPVRRAGKFRTGRRADDVRDCGAAGGGLDPEIPVLEKRAQSALEARAARMADGKALGRHRVFPPSIRRIHHSVSTGRPAVIGEEGSGV
jgi:hypothetical protein